MQSMHSGGPGHAAASMVAATLMLQGCAEAPSAGATWLFITLALALAALVSYALGRAHAARQSSADLRQARTEARQWRDLDGAWLWHGDAEHRLRLWQGPGSRDTTRGPALGVALTELFTGASQTPGLTALLSAERGFSGLRVDAVDAQRLGGPHWLLSASPCYDDAGRFTGHVGHARPTGADNATQLAAAALQRPAPAPAVASAEAAEGETFSFTVSHDLRAPIRVVEGFTRIVKEDYGRLLDRVGNDHLDRVLGAAARMNLMIDALLTLARLSAQPLAQQPVDLSLLASYVMDDLRRGAPERQVNLYIEPGLTAQGDPTLLRLVLENLLGNAWKYTARCTTADIGLRRFNHGSVPAFEVTDNGAGFDMRSAERLFGLFQRLHSANDFPGHGVGLASVKRIVQRHGGEIWAEAEPGRGAAFRFTLAP